MNNQKWQKYLDSLKYPGSLTSEEEVRRSEADYFITWATRFFDKKDPLLILGCGDGYEVKLALAKGFENVRGITFDKREYANVRKQKLKSYIVRGDIHEMPFENKEFQNVISKETLEHMISPYIALHEINRVMKVGGKFVHLMPEGEVKQSEYYHVHCSPSYQWIDLLKKTGFVVEENGANIQQNYFKGHKEHDV